MTGLVGLSWAAWNVLRRPRIVQSNAISLHDALSVLQVVFASVAGAGALVALIVAYRRQKVAESDSSHDRTRVFNERFTAIAAQLGDSEPAVRLAGVHAMAGLADDWAENRQTCVDVLCAYLRMPRESGEAANAADPRPQAVRASGEVRETVLRVIASHLRSSASVSWEGLDFDFTGVVFEGGDFRNVIFSGGRVSFRDAVFASGTLDFGGAIFAGARADFGGAKFLDGVVNLGSGEFRGGDINFGTASFEGGILDFSGAVFSGSRVGFLRATLSAGEVVFNDAVFAGGRIFFNRAAFSGSRVSFSGAMFVGSTVEFLGVLFSRGEVDFTNVLFSSGQTQFSFAKFCGSKLAFSYANFSPPTFDTVYRAGNAVDYRSAMLSALATRVSKSGLSSAVSRLAGGAELNQLSSGVLVNFSFAEFVSGSVLFNSAEFSGGLVDFRDSKFLGGRVDFSDVQNWSVPPLGVEAPSGSPATRDPDRREPRVSDAME